MSTDPSQNSSTADRENHVALADAENRIDGLIRDPQTDTVFNAYAIGEIAVTDIIVRLHALLGL